MPKFSCESLFSTVIIKVGHNKVSSTFYNIESKFKETTQNKIKSVNKNVYFAFNFLYYKEINFQLFFIVLRKNQNICHLGLLQVPLSAFTFTYKLAVHLNPVVVIFIALI